MIKRIDHIAVVVDDLDGAMEFWRTALGLELGAIEDVPDQESRIAFFRVGDSEIELVTPTSEASGVARFLKKHGPGMHHVCLEVENIEAVMDRLKSHGVRLITETPQPGSGGKKLAFIHPTSANGVLVELYELPRAAAG